MAIYMAALSLGHAGGPAILSVIGTGQAAYLIGAAIAEAEAMRLVTALMIGAIALQLPSGVLADRVSRPRLVMVLALISALGARAWPFVLANAWLAYATVFVWGGVFVGIYTVMLAIVGERFGGAELVGIYAMMGLAWSVGALVGPASVGLGMELDRTWGLPIVVAAGCALFAMFMAAKRDSA